MVNYHRDSDLYELDFPADIPVPVADAAAGLKMAQTWFPEIAREDFKFLLKTQPGYLIEVAETVDVPTVRHDSVAIVCALSFLVIDPDPASHFSFCF
jgi:hypothetical protein